MALDGLTVASLVNEFNHHIIDARIDKAYQPESDEIVLLLRKLGHSYRLLLTSHSNNPRIHFTNIKKENPQSPPMFCMLLRKHLVGGRIIKVVQPDFERIIELYIQNKNEMGDLVTKKLIIEIMGKHSNVILVNEKNNVIDSVKHVSREVSSKREVLPGKEYVYPPTQNKLNPLNDIAFGSFINTLRQKDNIIQKALYLSFTGISPIIATEICFRANMDMSKHSSIITDEEYNSLFYSFKSLFNELKENEFHPLIIMEANGNMIDFSPIYLKQFSSSILKNFETISETLEYYYEEKDIQSRIKQKSYDLKKIIQNSIDRCNKKYSIQIKQLKDTKSREKFKIKGELITSNIYAIKKGMTKFTTINFYDENQSEITIDLKHNLTPSENAQKYFKKYNKLKRTFYAVTEQIEQTKEELDYLHSVMNSLEHALSDHDIMQIREELHHQGYIRKKKKMNKKPTKSKPLQFVSSEGIDILVGKNNIQNDQLTFKISSPFDLWFHAKDMPGSHAILCSNNKEYTEVSILEAAEIAAFYSKGKNSSKVPIDYTQRRYVKKPNGSKPGFVIYTDQQTVYITPDEKNVKERQKTE